MGSKPTESTKKNKKGDEMKTKTPKRPNIKDDETKRMLDSWDIVRCHYCGKKISMLNAKSINSGQYFICSGEH